MSAPSGLDHLTSWHSEWRGLKALVLGLGLTGFSVADTLAELGVDVLVLASEADPERAELLRIIGAELITRDLNDGSTSDATAFAPDLVVTSPGFRPSHPLIAWAGEAGIPVWGDVELAWRLRDKVAAPAQWLAVTGTNGKTTTAHLAEAMLLEDGRRAIACGNIGVPILDAIRDPVGWEVIVVELSSFQLHYLESMSAEASVCLNLADDHLDWHGSAEKYSADKALVYRATRVGALYNRSDDATLAMVEDADVVEGCRAIGFGLGVPGLSDFGVVDGILCDRAFLDNRRDSAIELITVQELNSVGLASPHMVSNVLAASALVRAIGVAPGSIRSALLRFTVDHHRSETLIIRHGIRWVNDSKATNPHAALAALASFESVVWIVGGLLKGVAIEQVVVSQAHRLKAVVIIGADRDALRGAFKRHAPQVPVFEVDTIDTEKVMPSAVSLSYAVALSGDVVLLAPAAASMDQFTNYAERGDKFTRAVHELLGDEGDDNE